MPELLEQSAPWIALAAGVLAIAIIAIAGWRMWKHWTRVNLTQQASVALLDVHRDRLDATIAQINDRMGTLADDGEDLAESLAELRADARHLRWMLGRVPAEQDRLRRELLELVLPTRSGSRDA